MRYSKIKHHIITVFIFCLLLIVSQSAVAVASFAASNGIPVFTETGTFVAESAGLYTTWVNEPYYGYWQSIVDNPDLSLLMVGFYDVPILADHSNQDFVHLYDVQYNDTASMTMDNGLQANYQCTAVFEGINIGSHLVTLDGTPILNEYDTDLILYTCKRSRYNPYGVLITLWQEIDEIPAEANAAY